MKTRGWKKLGVIIGIVTVVFISAVIIFLKLTDLNRYNPLIVTQVEKAIGGEVGLGNLSWGISDGIWLEINDFSIHGASAFPVDVRLSRIYIHVSISPLLEKKLVVNNLLLEGAEVSMRLAP